MEYFSKSDQNDALNILVFNASFCFNEYSFVKLCSFDKVKI